MCASVADFVADQRLRLVQFKVAWPRLYPWSRTSYRRVMDNSKTSRLSCCNQSNLVSISLLYAGSFLSLSLLSVNSWLIQNRILLRSGFLDRYCLCNWFFYITFVLIHTCSVELCLKTYQFAFMLNRFCFYSYLILVPEYPFIYIEQYLSCREQLCRIEGLS